MKDSILLPLRLLLLCLLCLLLVFVTVFLYYNVTEYPAPDEVHIARRAAGSLTAAIIPALLCALIAAYFVLNRHPGVKTASYGLLFLAIYALFSTVLFQNHIPSALPPSPVTRIQPGIIHQYRQQSLFIHQKDDTAVFGVVILKHQADTPPRIQTGQSGLVITETGMLYSNDSVFILEPPNPVVTELLNFPDFMKNLLRDLQFFNQILLQSRTYVLLFSLFFCGLWFLSRVSSWPLYNFLAVIFCVRVSLYISWWTGSTLATRIFTAWNLSQSQVLWIIFGSSGALLIIADLLVTGKRETAAGSAPKKSEKKSKAYRKRNNK